MVSTKQDIINGIIKNESQIKEKWGVSKIGLFGSFVRNEQNDESDIDLLVEFNPQRKTFGNFMGLCFFLESLFGRDVEVITPESLSPGMTKYISKEVEYAMTSVTEKSHSIKTNSKQGVLSKMSLSIHEYLSHILIETEYLLVQKEKINKHKFMEDDTLKRAFVRSLEIIGEAAKKIPSSLRNKHDQIEWKSMAGMGDRLIHAYFGVDYEVVWNVISDEIPS